MKTRITDSVLVMIKDKRRFNFFMTDNEIFNFDIDCYAFKIYSFLIRMCSNKKKSFPSLEYISDKCKISKPKVISSLKDLANNKLIYITKSKSNKNNYVRNNYYIVDIKNSVNAVNQENLVIAVNPNNTTIPSYTMHNVINKNKNSIKSINKKKVKYGALVKMYTKQYDKLIKLKNKEYIDRLIKKMNNWCLAKDKPYKNYYRALLNWIEYDKDKSKDNKGIEEKKMRDDREVRTDSDEYDRKLKNFKKALKDRTDEQIELYQTDKKYRKAVKEYFATGVILKYINTLDAEYLDEYKKDKLFIFKGDRYIINNDIDEYYERAIRSYEKKLKKELFKE